MALRERPEAAWRALAVQAIVDRGWVDMYGHKNTMPADEKAKAFEIFQKTREWLTKEGILEHMTPAERAVYDKPPGKLTRQEADNCTDIKGILDVLLWYIGVEDAMPLPTFPTKDDRYDKIFFFKDDPVWKILSTYPLPAKTEPLNARTPANIEYFMNGYLLLYWRCLELRDHAVKKSDMTKSLPDIFDAKVRESLPLFPLNSDNDIIIDCYQFRISDLRKGELKRILGESRGRYRGLAWLLNREPMALEENII